MKFYLSDLQKQQLKDLFEASTVDFSLLFFIIESNLLNIDIPKSHSNKVQAIDEANLMLEISKASLKLSKLIGRLNERSKQEVNYVLVNPIFESYSLAETDKYHLNADAKEMTKRLHLHCDFKSKFIKGRYGRGKWDKVVDAVCHAWPTELATENKITLSCKLVRFFSIILEDDSYESIFKFIKRSSWYQQHFVAMTDWQDN
jgi:hypothetical protein